MKKRKHSSILPLDLEAYIYGRIYAVGTCNFGVRRVNTDVSLDNNIPVGFKA